MDASMGSRLCGGGFSKIVAVVCSSRYELFGLSKRFLSRTRRFAVFCIIGQLFILSGAAYAADTPPAMIVPGQFNVSATGAATYTIPIAVPPGTAGMVPALTLDYSSQNGDGIVGLGWSLNGLPSIGRCSSTFAQDGARAGVVFGPSDKFCMEGQRLISAGTSSLCTNGIVYHTEIEGFSRIVACGTAGSGPAYFMVWTKFGQIMEFGNTPDSKVPIVAAVSGNITWVAGTLRAWAVNKISDTAGNYLKVIYNYGTPDTVNGQVYPTEIDYTGNGSVSPYNSVQFIYDTSRDDVTPTYQAGSLQQTTVLLTDVKTYAGSSVVYDYQLVYRPGTSTLHSRLTSVTLCDVTTSNCLAPTTFGWQGGTGLPTITAVPNGIAQGKKIHYGNGTFYVPNPVPPTDFNGDGLTDILIELPEYPYPCPPASSTVYLGTQSGTFAPATVTAIFQPPPPPLYQNGPACFFSPSGGSYFPHTSVVDLNSDGLSDIVADGGLYMLNNGGLVGGGSSATLNQSWLTSPSGNNNQADFNGDGRVDDTLFGNWAAGPLVDGFVINNGNGFTTESHGFDFEYSQPTDAILTGDFDGDGCADMLVQIYRSPKTITYSPDCSPVQSSIPVSDWLGNNQNVTLGDFNGDGKTDILVTSKSGAGTLYLSSGTGLIATSFAVPSDWGKYLIVTGDWNGDGKTDIALIAPGGSGNYGVGTPHSIWLSTGTGFVQAATIPNNDSHSTSVSAASGDWNNDGASDIWLQKPVGTDGVGDVEELFSFVPELMTSVSNGIGATTTISYDRLNKNGTFYTKGSGSTYPTEDVDGPFYVVSRVDASNGRGDCTPPSTTNCYSSTYAYAGAKVDHSGRGFLGFAQMTVTDLQTNVVQTATYSTVFPYVGLITAQTKTHGGTTLSSVTNTYNDDATNCGVTSPTGVYFVCLTESEVASHDLDGTPMLLSKTDYAYDGYGNARTVLVGVSDGSSKNTTNTYFDADTTNWILGRLKTASVVSIVAGTQDLTRHSAFEYESGTGLLTREVVEPTTSNPAGCNSSGVICLQTDYTYDAFGHRVATTVSGPGIATRTSHAHYDSLGEFQTFATNALGQSESWAFTSDESLAFGAPTSHTGPNGLTTSWTYDSFGRSTLESRPDGTKTSVSYAYCSGVNGGTASCVSGASYRKTVEAFASNGTTQIGPIAITYYDSLSRTIAQDVQGFNASYIRTATQYDRNGRVQQTSRPYFVSGGTAKWTVFQYDDLGRVIIATAPNDGVTNFCFSGLKTWATNALGQTTETINNAQGLKASVTQGTFACGTDGSGSNPTTTYVYDALGNLKTVTDPSGNVTTNVYDFRGNKTDSTDPDMGHWTYVHDTLGQLTSQTDAKGQTTTLTYDLLGRVTHRVEAGSLHGNWVYDTAAHGIGKLAASCTSGSSNPTCNSSATTLRSFAYDSLGRPAATVLLTGGEGFTYATSYNATTGQIANVAYPDGLVTKYVYTSLGHLCRIAGSSGSPTCASEGGAQIFWTIKTRDAEMHATQSLAGNGLVTNQSFDPETGLPVSLRAGGGGSVAEFDYTFNTIGTLTSRTDGVEAYTERFCYDSLNRLTSYKLSTSTSCPLSGTGTTTVAYDTLGNIASKSDVGSYTYGAGAAGPHAVTSVTGTVDGVVNPKYTYDANGNLTCASTGTGCTGTVARTVTWTVFNMAATITQGSTSVTLSYDTDHARIKQVAVVSGTTTTTTYLNDPASGAMAQRVATGSAAPVWQDYLTVDGQIVAMRSARFATASAWGTAHWGNFVWGGQVAASTWGSPHKWGSFAWAAAPSSTSWVYFTLDHLGSVAVVTDQFGAVVERASYDAWGKRRHADGSAAACYALSSATTRGFTNQEMMDSVCLVNLNARLYDPTLGRFMSADPMVEDPYNLQILNRYSYVLNNPLSFTDPSGMCFLGCFWNSGTFRGIAELVAVVTFQEWVLPEIEGTSFAALTSAAGGGSASAITTLGVNAGIAGGIGGAIGSGTLKGALFSAAEAVTFFEVGNLIEPYGGTPTAYLGSHTVDAFVSHGLVGGIFSVAQGGNFGSGFLAAGIATLAPAPTGNADWGDIAEGTAKSAILGGVGSVLGGGKFANGAETGAFGYLFNMVPHVGTPAQQAAAQRAGWNLIRGTLEVGAFIFGGEVIDVARAALWGTEEVISAVELGRVGEAAVRGAYDIGQPTAIDVAGGGIRIPDGLTRTTLSEVKNVQLLSYTQQLQDFAGYAQENGLNFDLYVRPSTRLSTSVLNAESRGDLAIKFIPGAK